MFGLKKKEDYFIPGVITGLALVLIGAFLHCIAFPEFVKFYAQDEIKRLHKEISDMSFYMSTRSHNTWGESDIECCYKRKR